MNEPQQKCLLYTFNLYTSWATISCECCKGILNNDFYLVKLYLKS